MLVHNFVAQYQIFSVGAAEIFLGANQLSSKTVGAAPKTQRRTSGAAKAWIPPWVGSYENGVVCTLRDSLK